MESASPKITGRGEVTVSFELSAAFAGRAKSASARAMGGVRRPERTDPLYGSWARVTVLGPIDVAPLPVRVRCLKVGRVRLEHDPPAISAHARADGAALAGLERARI